MKKHYLAVVFAAVACFVAPKSGNSQVLISLLFGEQLNSGKMEFGLITGLNTSTIIGAEDPSFLPTFKLGLFFDYNISEHWVGSFEANVRNTLGYVNFTPEETLFEVQDSIITLSNKTVRTISALQTPIFINYRFKNRLSIGAGGYLSYQHGTRDFIDYTYRSTNLTIEQSFTEFVNKIDAGLVGALGYHFKKRESGYPGMSIRVKASYGLTDVYTESSGLSGNNFWMSFDLAIPIIMSVF